MKIKKKKLNHRQERFCKLYATDKEFFCNGVQSYIEAYDIDVNKKGAYNGARANASEQLTKTNILERINELIEESGLNDAFVDKQLLKMINQDADFKVKVSAIKEYNVLQQRIKRKLEIETDQETKDALVGIIDKLNEKV